MSDPIPLYVRIRRDLKDRITAGTYAPNQALPTEAQICEQFGVSRITVTKALDEFKQGFQTSDGKLLAGREEVESLESEDVEQEQIVRRKRG